MFLLFIQPGKICSLCLQQILQDFKQKTGLSETILQTGPWGGGGARKNLK